MGTVVISHTRNPYTHEDHIQAQSGTPILAEWRLSVIQITAVARV